MDPRKYRIDNLSRIYHTFTSQLNTLQHHVNQISRLAKKMETDDPVIFTKLQICLYAWEIQDMTEQLAKLTKKYEQEWKVRLKEK